MWYDLLLCNLTHGSNTHLVLNPTQCALENCAGASLNCESYPSETWSAKFAERTVHFVGVSLNSGFTVGLHTFYCKSFFTFAFQTCNVYQMICSM